MPKSDEMAFSNLPSKREIESSVKSGGFRYVKTTCEIIPTELPREYKLIVCEKCYNKFMMERRGITFVGSTSRM